MSNFKENLLYFIHDKWNIIDFDVYKSLILTSIASIEKNFNYMKNEQTYSLSCILCEKKWNDFADLLCIFLLLNMK